MIFSVIKSIYDKSCNFRFRRDFIKYFGRFKGSTNFALAYFGYPTRSLEEVRNFVGNGVRKLIERAVPKDCSNTEECLEIFKKNYSENMYNHTKPYMVS